MERHLQMGGGRLKGNAKKSYFSGMVLLLCLLCGCSGKSEKQEDSGLAAYGRRITVKEIKQKYSYSNDSIMPLYNVAPDEAFDFTFQSDLSDAAVGEDVVTVHTDVNCLEESAVITYHTVEQTGTGSKVTVSPVAGVLLTETEEEEYLKEDHGVWGNAPTYYIAIHYDMESNSPQKLEKPTVIPFTIKQEIKAPEVKGVVDSAGRFQLSWDAVPGAEEYRIYKLLNSEGQSSGESNEPLNGAQTGYSESSLILDAVTDNTEFDNFAGGESHGLAVLEDSLNDVKYIIGQNYSVNGEYYVSAVVDGKESGFCGAIPTADLKLPHELTESCDIMNERYKSTSELPRVLEVVNIDGSVTERKVLYTYQEQITYLGTTIPGYQYQIEGTAITGSVTMEDMDGDYPESVGEFTPSGNIEPENKVEKQPTSDLPTIIDPEGSGEDKENLLEQQKENTENHVADGDEDEVENPYGEAQIFADSAEEEWLALNLVNGVTDISVEAFPVLQNTQKLEDTFYKVYYQNPYILGLSRFSYDYGSMTLHVDYSYDKQEMRRKQKEMVQKSEAIISEIIESGMDMQERELAVYDYLTEQCEYDTEALESARENNFRKTEDNRFEDSFNGYGILVNKKGVCQSYAYAYKLLCEQSGISCRVMTGNLDGNLPHAWNSVKIGKEWFQTDATNNEKTAGIPYFLYNADSTVAELVGFDTDKNFELDERLEQYQTENEKYEYYTCHQLVADNMEQYETILDSQLAEEKDLVSIRYMQEKVDQEELITVVRKVYNKRGMESKLNELTCGIKGRYIILK